MLASKLTFNLVFLGDGKRGKYLAYFRVLHMDPRFRGATSFVASNGYRVMSSSYPELEPDTDMVALWGSHGTRDNDPDFVVFSAASETAARAKLQRAVDALQDWAAHCPSVAENSSYSGISSEVRESLIEADLNTSDTEEEMEPAAPIFFDEFVPPKIALA